MEALVVKHGKCLDGMTAYLAYVYANRDEYEKGTIGVVDGIYGKFEENLNLDDFKGK